MLLFGKQVLFVKTLQFWTNIFQEVIAFTTIKEVEKNVLINLVLTESHSAQEALAIVKDFEVKQGNEINPIVSLHFVRIFAFGSVFL